MAKTPFSACCDHLGLSNAEVASLLGQKLDTILAKKTGARMMTEQDRIVFAGIWTAVRRGEGTAQGWPVGVENAGIALKLLRGVQTCMSQARRRKGRNSIDPVREDGESDEAFTKRFAAEREVLIPRTKVA